jgi:CO/xanthine dehydrogenase FAD-binding subunit
MGVAASLRLRGDKVEVLRAATTAVDTVPHFADFSAELQGQVARDVVSHVAEEMMGRAQPKKNTAMPVGYRKKMVGVFLGRLLEDLLAGRSEGRTAAA